MTIRRRIKQKWHLKLEDFEFKRASYNPDGTKTFEVWYKNDLIGDCKVTNSYYSKIKDWKTVPFHIPRIEGMVGLQINKRITSLESKKPHPIDFHIIGRLYCIGQKNGFPTKIVYVEIYPEGLNIVAKRKMLLEKYPDKTKENRLIDILLNTINARIR